MLKSLFYYFKLKLDLVLVFLSDYCFDIFLLILFIAAHNISIFMTIIISFININIFTVLRLFCVI